MKQGNAFYHKNTHRTQTLKKSFNKSCIHGEKNQNSTFCAGKIKIIQFNLGQEV